VRTIWLRAALAISLLHAAATINVLSATSLSTCVNTGSSAQNCSQRLVVTATLQNGEADGTGALVNSLADAGPLARDGVAVTPADSVFIVLTQSAITLVFLLTYVQYINGAPNEAVLTVDAGGAPLCTQSV